MKIRIQSRIIADALSKLLTVIDKKNIRPILTNCLVTAKDNKLTLTGTDMEISSQLVLEADVEREGSFCIISKGLADILRMLPDKQMQLSLDEEVAKLTCGDIQYSLLTANPDDFPKISFIQTEEPFRLKAKDIINLINKTSHAVSTDETRLYLNGIFLQQTDQAIRAVAIDGHRLAMLDIPEFLGNSAALQNGVIVPRKGIAEIKKLAESCPDKDILVSINDSFMSLNAQDEYFLSIRLIAREYPNYKAVIPQKTTYKMNVDKPALYDAVRRIRILSNEKTHGIKMKIDAETLTLSANHPSLGEAFETISCSYDGNPMEIGFNAKYLLDSLTVHDESEVVFEFNNELSPVIVKSASAPHFLGIIMPLKL